LGARRSSLIAKCEKCLFPSGESLNNLVPDDNSQQENRQRGDERSSTPLFFTRVSRMMRCCFFMGSPLLFVPLHIWRDHVLKTFGIALLLAFGLSIAGAPVRALQVVVTQVDKNTDGSMTYHFAVKTDQGEVLAPGESKETSDFVTIYNFYGLVDGTVKSPEGWEFSSEEFGRTPYWNGIACS
jgi:hypothetical protein